MKKRYEYTSVRKHDAERELEWIMQEEMTVSVMYEHVWFNVQ